MKFINTSPQSFLLPLVGSALSLWVITSCGGAAGGGAAAGGSSAASIYSISGVAVAGAPIIGGVTIKDSSTPPKDKYALIEADGTYTVDVSDLTPPFMLRADGTVGGKTYSIYSAAAAADIGGTINVTPLTDLIVANIAGDLAANYFDSGNFSTMTTNQLDTAKEALRLKIKPILDSIGLSDSIDLLRTSFSADHTGLDAALDVINVSTDPITKVATLTNVLNNQQINNDVTTGGTTGTFDTTGMTTGIADLQAITGGFTQFSALFATRLPTLMEAAPFFDDSFNFDGQNKTQFLSEITTNEELIGLKFTNVTLVPGSVTASTAKVSFVVLFEDVVEDSPTWDLVKAGGFWRIKGNTDTFERTRAESFARIQNAWFDGSFHNDYIDTGLQFNIKAPGTTVDYAIVKGDGLPIAGILYVNFTSNNSFTAANFPYNGDSTARLSGFGHNQIPLDDTAIGQISDEEEYKIRFYEDNSTPSDTADDSQVGNEITAKLMKKPYLNTQLVKAKFATINTPTQAALRAYGASGGSLTVSWTVPTGLATSSLSYYQAGCSTATNPCTGTGVSRDAQARVSRTSSSGTIITTAPGANYVDDDHLQASGINLFMRDSFGRELVTIINGFF